MKNAIQLFLMLRKFREFATSERRWHVLSATRDDLGRTAFSVLNGMLPVFIVIRWCIFIGWLVGKATYCLLIESRTPVNYGLSTTEENY